MIESRMRRPVLALVGSLALLAIGAVAESSAVSGDEPTPPPAPARRVLVGGACYAPTDEACATDPADPTFTQCLAPSDTESAHPRPVRVSCE